MLKVIQLYLAVVFFVVVTPLSLLRSALGRRPIKLNRRRDPASHWLPKKKNGLGPAGGMITTMPAGSSLFGHSLSTFLKKGQLDCAFILLLLLPVKLFLRVDRSTEVDPSIYVMY
jgi:hypothetical protein